MESDRPSCPRCGAAMTRGTTTKTGVAWQCRRQAGNRTRWCASITRRHDGIVTDGARGARVPEADRVPLAEVVDRADPEAPAIYRRDLGGAQTFIVTSAQNATPVHGAFFETLKSMAAILDAELLVVPFRIKNPTSTWDESQQGEEVWCPEVVPFLWNTRHALNENLTLLGDFKITPTAVDPLNGLDAVTGSSSAIVGHAKVAERMVPSPASKTAKRLISTGACTVANYSDTRAGKTGEFHHALSALLVEVEGSQFYARHVHFDVDSLSVVDIDVEFFPDGTTAEAQRPAALVLGDVHVGVTSPVVEEATFGRHGMVPTLQPERVILHDVFDGMSVNPHAAGDPFRAVALAAEDRDDVAAEVRAAWDWIVTRTPVGCEAVVVASNHDDFLRRWLCQTDWRKDPRNAGFYLELAGKLAAGAGMTLGGPRYAAALKTAFAALPLPAEKNVRLLDEDESFVLVGIELGQHGSRGPNGSRGSIRNHRRLGMKSVIGHSHSPGISEGCYQVGTSTALRLDYNSGPSSWATTHCVVHASGKRQLLYVLPNGKWRRQ